MSIITLTCVLPTKHQPSIYLNAIKKAALKSPSLKKIFRKEDEMVQLQMPAERVNSVNVNLSKEISSTRFTHS